ncbi:MAG: hypothetical protein J7J52_05330 [Deltaproteobacteria bacterium]|nr:hypothetical protein [Deltaproteobacteria bacterium]
MKTKLKLCLFAIISICFYSACGQTVRKTVVSQEPEPVHTGFKRVVVLPFADYTPSPSPYTYSIRDRMITEALCDDLYRAGFVPAVEEDVVKYLIDNRIIKPLSGRNRSAGSVRGELENNEWSPAMKKELRKLIHNNGKVALSDYGKKINLIALDNAMVKNIGEAFDADYVIRGRILVFRSGDDNTFNPLQTGILPFFLETTNRTIFGVARAHRYDSFGVFSLTPVLNTVQVRMFVQDAHTGDLVWTNRAEAKVAPRTVYADHDREILFRTAIKKAVRALADNFRDDVASGRLVQIHRAGDKGHAEKSLKGTDVDAVGLETSSSDAQEAARMARQFAKEASQAAEDARQAARQARDAEQGAKKASSHTQRAFEKLNAK